MKDAKQEKLLRRVKKVLDLFQNEATDHDRDGERCWNIYPDHVTPREIEALQKLVNKELTDGI